MKYVIGRYSFSTKEEYKAGLRDADKIKELAAVQGTDLERSKIIIKRIQKENIRFETFLGQDFLLKLNENIKREEFEHHFGKRMWFYIKYPLVSIAAAILISQSISSTVDGIKNHFHMQELKEEKEAAQKKGEAGKHNEENQKNNKKKNQENKGGESKRNNQKNNEEKDTKKNTKKNTEKITEENSTKQQIVKITEEKRILPQYLSLYEKNSDMSGWLTIPETEIDYPVMYRMEDDTYYLNHDFNKEEDKSGLLVLDKRCKVNQTKGQLIIYGHNMRSGAMFGSLLNYKEESYYKYNPMIQFDSIYEEGSYEIISVFLSEVFYQDEEKFKFYDYTEFSSKEEFDYYYENIKKLSLYEIDTEATYEDTLLCLVTCEYSNENGRLVVVARKVKERG